MPLLLFSLVCALPVRASILLFTPGSDPQVSAGLVTAARLALGATTRLVTAGSEAELCAGLLAADATLFIAPSFQNLPLGLYANNSDTVGGALAAAAPQPCAVNAANTFFQRGGRLLAAPGGWPGGWFVDLPPKLFSLNIFSPYEAYQSPNASLAGLEGLNVTAALAFGQPRNFSLLSAVPAADWRGRPRGLGAAAWLPGGAFSNSCWALSGVAAPAAAYGEPRLQAALAALVAACASPPPPPPPPTPPPCPCAARGSGAAPRLPRLAIDGTGAWAFPNGTRFLALGVDVFRDESVSLADNATVGAIFSQVAASGANAVRLYGWDPTTLPGGLFDCALDCATAHGVYLLPTIDGHPDAWGDLDALRAHAGAVAAAVAGETAVFALDACNEPYSFSVAALRAGAAPGAPTLGAKHNYSGAAYQAFTEFLAPGPGFSTFPALARGLPPPPPALAAFRAGLGAMWAEWARAYASAVAAAAPATPLCVGFNHWEALLPELLAPGGPAFFCSHAYADTGGGFANATLVAYVPTVMDRLAAGVAAAGAPPRPVLLGETGASNGAGAAGRGTAPLSLAASAVFNIAPHLLSLARGHGGAFRWAVTDVPFVWAAAGMPWLGNASAGGGALVREGRFGLRFFDGTPAGGEKPCVAALREVRALLNDLSAAGALAPGVAWQGWGRFSTAPSAAPANQIATRVAYAAPGAYFVGDAEFDDGAALRFTAGAAVVVAVRWAVAPGGAGGVCVVATGDCAAAVVADAFAPGAPPAASSSGAWRQLDLLAGQRICV